MTPITEHHLFIAAMTFFALACIVSISQADWIIAGICCAATIATGLIGSWRFDR